MKSARPNKITLQSKNGVRLEVDNTLATQSETIRNLREQGHNTNIVHVNVTSWILSRVVQYWNLQITSDDTKAEVNMKLRAWNAKFEDDVDETMDLVMAANYLNCKELISVMRKMVEKIEPEQAAFYFELRGVGDDDEEDVELRSFEYDGEDESEIEDLSNRLVTELSLK